MHKEMRFLCLHDQRYRVFFRHFTALILNIYNLKRILLYYYDTIKRSDPKKWVWVFT